MSLFMQKQGTGTASSKMSFWYIGQFSHKCRCPIHVLYNNICHTESPIEKPQKSPIGQFSHRCPIQVLQDNICHIESPIEKPIGHQCPIESPIEKPIGHRCPIEVLQVSYRKTYRTLLSHRSPIGFLQDFLSREFLVSK